MHYGKHHKTGSILRIDENGQPVKRLRISKKKRRVLRDLKKQARDPQLTHEAREEIVAKVKRLLRAT